MIRPSAPAPWAMAFVVPLPHGVVAGVHIPDAADPVPEPILARLLEPERRHAQSLHGYRQVQFAGGRLAASLALAELGSRRVPILSDEHGAPQFPSGVGGSVSHKNDLAVALAARGELLLGVDLEDTDRERPGVAARVLTPREVEANLALPAERRWVDAVLRFSVKEAVYKAIHPALRRYIGFGEVEVWPGNDGTDRVAPLSPDVAAFTFEARHAWLGSRVLATVKARRA